MHGTHTRGSIQSSYITLQIYFIDISLFEGKTLTLKRQLNSVEKG